MPKLLFCDLYYTAFSKGNIIQAIPFSDIVQMCNVGTSQCPLIFTIHNWVSSIQFTTIITTRHYNILYQSVVPFNNDQEKTICLFLLLYLHSYVEHCQNTYSLPPITLQKPKHRVNYTKTCQLSIWFVTLSEKFLIPLSTCIFPVDKTAQIQLDAITSLFKEKGLWPEKWTVECQKMHPNIELIFLPAIDLTLAKLENGSIVSTHLFKATYKLNRLLIDNIKLGNHQCMDNQTIGDVMVNCWDSQRYQLSCSWLWGPNNEDLPLTT